MKERIMSRNEKIFVMVLNGYTYVDAGNRYGISSTRARTVYMDMRRKLLRATDKPALYCYDLRESRKEKVFFYGLLCSNLNSAPQS
jgi:hypothetical protein